ncbi:MAG: hypothetical protein DRP63_03445 [Planctomycetota bacterium]|nr:MAG: hypothetical protein DRP63_03445 [Planctomycetota bacterium]
MRWLLIATLFVCASTAVAQQSDDAVIVVNGEKITKKDFLHTSLFMTVPFLLREKLLEQAAKRLGVEIDEDAVREQARRMVEQFKKDPHAKEHLHILKKLGLSEKALFEMVYRDTRIRILGQEVARKRRLTEEFLRERFEELFPKNETLYHVMLIRIHKTEKINELQREGDSRRKRLLRLQNAIIDLQKAEKEPVAVPHAMRDIVRAKLGKMGDALTLKERDAAVKIAKQEAEKLRTEIDQLDKKRKKIEAMSEKEYVEMVRERLAREPFEKVAQEEAVGWLRYPEGYDPGYGRLIAFKKELRPVITTLKKGQVSKPVKTIMGYFFLKLVDKKGPGELKFEDVREQLRSRFEKMPIYDGEVEDLIRKLEKDAKIELRFDAVFGNNAKVKGK